METNESISINKGIENLESMALKLGEQILKQDEMLAKIIKLVEALNIDTYVSETYCGHNIKHSLYFGAFSSGTNFRYQKHDSDTNEVVKNVLELELQDRALAYHAINAFIEEKVIDTLKGELAQALEYISED